MNHKINIGVSKTILQQFTQHSFFWFYYKPNNVAIRSLSHLPDLKLNSLNMLAT